MEILDISDDQYSAVKASIQLKEDAPFVSSYLSSHSENKFSFTTNTKVLYAKPSKPDNSD